MSKTEETDPVLKASIGMAIFELAKVSRDIMTTSIMARMIEREDVFRLLDGFNEQLRTVSRGLRDVARMDEERVQG